MANGRANILIRNQLTGPKLYTVWKRAAKLSSSQKMKHSLECWQWKNFQMQGSK